MQDYNKFLKSQFSLEEAEPWLCALESPPEVSIRINALKPSSFDANLLKSQVPFCDAGWMLKSRPYFSGDPTFHAGAYYVQDSSSMAIGEVVKTLLASQANPARVLDLCASPGGKSTHVSAVLRNNDWLVANEVIGSRVNTLIENLCKWGIPNFTVTSADAKLLGKKKELFDIVVADMPCSGEGMFRKNPKAISEWSLNNVELCAQRQIRIAHDVWPALKTNGYMVYSTCTFNKNENEQNVKQLCASLNAEVVAINNTALDKFKTSDNMYRLFPPAVEGEGLFFCVLKKLGEAATLEGKYAKSKFAFQSHELLKTEASAFKDAQQFYCLNKAAEFHLDVLWDLPGIKTLSYPMGKNINGELKPYGYLPLMVYFNDTALPQVELTFDEAQAYLCRDNMTFPELENGLALMHFNKVNLGLIQKIGSRINNLWPMDWRLRNKKSQ